MKLLHTSDWHLGKKLYKVELRQEHALFFDWLLQTIVDYEVEVLLVSGDVFDTAYPSQESLEAYYRFLAQLIKVSCKVIVTGGNHDSPYTLNAPSELLQHLDITVLGGLEQDRTTQLVPVYNAHHDLELVVAAVPFLRDQDLILEGPEDTQEERAQQVVDGILGHYRYLAGECASKYPGVPAIAMGHLFAKGVTTSDTEKNIQVGNLGAIDALDLPDYFRYYALGHIHKPQWVGGLDFVRYCGAPVPLSFSEAHYAREVLLIDTSRQLEYQGRYTYVPASIPVPEFRKLIRLHGNLDAIAEQLKEISASALPALVDLEIHESGSASLLQQKVFAFIKDHQRPEYLVANRKIISEDASISEQVALEHTIDSIAPEQVFELLLQQQVPSQQESLRALFLELNQIVQAELKEQEKIRFRENTSN
ncbi:MAG: exonuclease subunit SbcD [Cytophagaceae bacterium]|jgi:exonuclease SbcD|nr:exonuclease subunit SbcD [Cytophagaceae bacterium]